MILVIMFGALLSMTTALTFMEVRRIRKHLEGVATTRDKAKAAEV